MGTTPLSERYPEIPITNIPVADSVPPDEVARRKLWGTRFQAWLGRRVHQNQPHLPPIGADVDRELSRALVRHLGDLRPPVRPKEYEGPLDLGYIAVAGPYSCFLERTPEGVFQWDLLHLDDDYELHEGLYPLGVRVLFGVDKAARTLVATQIECHLGIRRPGDGDWDLAQKIALCAATNFLSLIRHFNNIHLVTAAPLAIATRNQLGGAHPLRRLLWPHVWGTQYSNELVTEILMMEHGDFEGVFSFTHSGLWKLFGDWYDRYDIRVIDPEVDAHRRGILDRGFDLPALDNRLAHLAVMREHTRSYLDLYYGSDQALRDDASIRAWVDELETRIPGGVVPLLGGQLTVAGLARLTAAFIYMGTVEHEVLGTNLWNYQLWTDVQPVRVYRNGQRVPVDVYQRLVNYNFILNVARAPLVQDFSAALGLDDRGRACFTRFYRDLQKLQADLVLGPHAEWKIYPEDLEASVNG